MTTSPMNLPQLAYALRTGELKPESLSERVLKQVKRFADTTPLDQLEAMAKPKPRAHFGFQRASGSMR